MTDVETGSFWSHITGGAIEGPLKGETLKTIPVVQTTWKEWLAKYPNTKILKKDEHVSSSHYEKYFKDPDRTGLFRTYWLQDRLPGKQMVLGIKMGLFTLAVVKDKLESEIFIETELGPSRVIVLKTDNGGAKAFKAEINNLPLYFKKGPKVFVEIKTNTQWDLNTGQCLAGKFKGEKLEELVLTPIFWFAWSNFYPNTQVID
jgi:hypothetical protein